MHMSYLIGQFAIRNQARKLENSIHRGIIKDSDRRLRLQEGGTRKDMSVYDHCMGSGSLL